MHGRLRAIGHAQAARIHADRPGRIGVDGGSTGEHLNQSTVPGPVPVDQHVVFDLRKETLLPAPRRTGGAVQP